jgi:hypothetical protein
LGRGPIRECAAGDGRLAKAIGGAGYTAIASDVEPRGESIERLDFLIEEPPRIGFIAATNPPFNQINRFLARGLHLLDQRQIAGLVLLVRWDAMTAATRAKAFNRAAGILTCCWRPVWIERSKRNGRWANAWVWWLPDYPGPPVTRCLPSERKRRQASLPFAGPAGSAP